MRWFVLFTSRRQIQTDQSFSGARHASDEANSLATFRLRFIDEFLNSSRRDVQILRASVESRDGFNRMLRIQRAGSFNDRRRRMIRRARPRVCIDWRTADLRNCAFKNAAKALRINNERSVKLVRVSLQLESADTPLLPSRSESE